MEDAPAKRSEDPLAEEQRCADDGQDEREQDERDRDPDEGRDLRDLPGDRRRFGPGEIDVRLDQQQARIADRADRRAQAGRRRGAGWRYRAGRWLGVQGAAPARGSGRSRARPARVRNDTSAHLAPRRGHARAASRDRYAAVMPPTPERRHLRTAEHPQHRVGADGRRDPRHQCRRAGTRAHPRGRDRRQDRRPPRQTRRRDRRLHDRLPAGGSRTQHGRARPDTRRSHPRVDRRRAGRDAGGRSGPRSLAARPLGTARSAVPRDQPQAGLAHPVE